MDTLDNVAEADNLGWNSMPGFKNRFDGDNLS